jgi:hypothetical protein
MKKRFSLSRVFKQRDKLFQAIRPYVGLTISGNTLHDLVADVYRVLPNYVSHDAVFESSRAIVGDELTRKIAAEFAWRLAGNIDTLITGRPVLPWTRQSEDEWVPVLVTRVDPAFRRGKPGFLFQLRVLAGSPCPTLFSHFMSKASCAGISHIVGFSRNMPYTSSAYFTGLKFWAHLNAARSGAGLFFQEVACPPSMQTSNRKILEIRTRISPCPRGFQHECLNCVVGYDTCAAAIHAKELELRLCPGCNLNSHFDLTRSDELCLTCWQRKLQRNTAGI